MTGVEIAGPAVPGLDKILSAEACAFVAMLERSFGGERRRLLAARTEFQAGIDAGDNPAFRPESKAVRDAEWTIAGTPADLADRRVEITGPVDRKMIINALNSGASCFMADFEDAASPTWEAMIAGQVNLRDAARRTIAMTDPNSGKSYALGDETATLIVRPRGWHLEEAHLLVDGRPAKWKIENSWGDEQGQKGIFQMSDSWFGEHVYGLAVHRDLLGAELAAESEAAPEVLPPWHTLA